MSQKYSGGFITKSPVAPTSSAASGIWTLDQQQQAQQAGNWPSPPMFIEDLFSTFLYTGTGASQTITNGIDLSTKGGLTWIKARTQPSFASNNALFDTARGAGKYLLSDATSAQATDLTTLSAFNTTGFSLGADAGAGIVNWSGHTFVSWTFREQPKFFDVVTYTGNSTNRTIAHNLGSVPGTIIVKRTDTAASWPVYHRSLGATKYIILNTANASGTYSGYWNDTEPTSSVFSVGGVSGEVNATGGTYVAYIFAHDAGGFGLTGTDNVISCGGFTANGNNTITLGYEPQWVMVRRVSSATNNWQIYDTMRGMALTSSSVLNANTTDAEGVGGTIFPTATGFYISSFGSGDIIYIAIRRGPMKVPTLGTSVFAVNYGNNLTGAGTLINSNTLVDMYIQKGWSSGTGSFTQDRMRGPNNFLSAADTAAEATSGDWRLDQNTGVGYGISRDLSQRIGWMFSRAPSFFDEVCYTGTNAAMTIGHNLTVVPELIINKSRTIAGSWFVYAPSASATFGFLNTTDAFSSLGSQVATATTYDPVSYSSTSTYVSYLFATCPGVSKVGTYTGNGTTQTINCGFTGGARFVLIKRTDATGDWYVYDTARGMTAFTDPYLWVNTSAAEVNTLGSVTTVATGFALNSAILAAINVSAGTYIFLAIA